MVIPDVRMVTDKVDTVMLAVDHVNRPVRCPGISEELHLTGIRSENSGERRERNIARLTSAMQAVGSLSLGFMM